MKSLKGGAQFQEVRSMWGICFMLLVPLPSSYQNSVIFFFIQAWDVVPTSSLYAEIQYVLNLLAFCTWCFNSCEFICAVALLCPNNTASLQSPVASCSYNLSASSPITVSLSLGGSEGLAFQSLVLYPLTSWESLC